MHTIRTRRRVVVATTTLALAATALLGAVAPAGAADAATITGKLTFPTGFEASDGEGSGVQVIAFTPDGRGVNAALFASVAEDGTYAFADVPAGASYHVMVYAPTAGLATGFYKAGGTEVPQAGQASLVRAGATGVNIKAVAAATASVKIVEPGEGESASTDEDSSYFPPLMVETDLNRIAGVPVDGDEAGNWTFGGLFPGASYRLVLATDESLTGSYYAGNGYAFVPTASGAVTIKAGSTGLTGYVAGPYATNAATVSGTAEVGSKLTGGAVSWSATSTSSYQWLRDGIAISGATSSSYTLAAGDLGKRVSVRVLAHPSSKTLGLVAETSAQTAAVVAGPSASLKSAPKISGTAAVGHKLNASAGTWSLPGVSASYQWLRGGTAISGATSSSYAVTTKDVGAKLSVRVTAKVAGHLSASASSASTPTVAKVKPSVSAKLSKSSAKRTSTVKVTVTVKATGVSKPTGKVTVKVGSKSVTKTVSASAKGKVVVTLPKQAKKGTYKVSVTYTPSGSTAKVVTEASASSHKLKLA